MTTERTRKLRRPAQQPPIKHKGTSGLVPMGTRGIYDDNPTVRKAVARAMVERRQRVPVACQAEGCVDPATGEPVVFMSRIVNGKPERRGHNTAHRLKIWRAEMRAKGYRQTSVNGQVGWLGPDNIFYPHPSQPKKRRQREAKRRQARNTQRRDTVTTEVAPESG